MTISTNTHNNLVKVAEMGLGTCAMIHGIKTVYDYKKAQGIANKHFSETATKEGSATQASADQKKSVVAPLTKGTWIRVGLEVIGGAALIVHGSKQ